MNTPLEMVIVCTGNVCRSPAAEYMFAHLLGHGSGVMVRSAGTNAIAGARLDARTGTLLGARGIDASRHRARLLTTSDLSSSHLVLTMTEDHRAHVATLFPAAVRRTFTLRRLAQIAGGISTDQLDATGSRPDPGGRMEALIALAPQYRLVTIDENVADPVGASARVAERVFEEIRREIEAIARILVPKAGH